MRIVLSAFVLVLLLAPIAYMFGQLWTGTGRSIETATNERAAVGYGRPLSTLLAVLADAQSAAVRRAPVDASGVRAAVDAVDRVDHQSTDPLRVRQRWARLAREIDGTLNQNPTGPSAIGAYAAPIALTQVLLDQIADSAKDTGDPGSGSNRLIDVALQRLPDVVASAGQVAALASTTSGTPTLLSTGSRPATPQSDPRWPVAVDRLARAADEVGVGLRVVTDAAADYAVDIRVLGLLDEFAAATDELAQTAAGLDGRGGDIHERIDAASTRVKTAALALGAAVLNALDLRLTEDARAHAVQRWILVLAGVVALLAAVALVWLREPGPAAATVGAFSVPRVGTLGGPVAGVDGADLRRGYPAEGGHVVPDTPERTRNLVDARELLTPELVHVGRAVRARMPREP